MLTDLAVRKAAPCDKPHKLSDGGGLYLLVTAAGQRYWRMDYRFGEKRATAATGVYKLRDHCVWNAPTRDQCSGGLRRR